MTRVLLLGAGNIGVAIAELLKRTQDYALTVADRDEERLQGIPAGVEKRVLDVTDRHALRQAMQHCDAVLSACPYFLNVPIAEIARELGVHYFDLTEDVSTAHRIRELAVGASTAFIPQCGLAPGFISIAAHDLTKRFDKLNRVRMRVGALPLFPSNALKYNLTWSTAGLINEYCNPCHVIHDGEAREVLPLEGLEEFSLDGVSYEAFNTSGGLGTLWETLRGKVEQLNYKTIRYPGHCELIRFLCNDLRLGERRKLFEDVLEHAVPVTTQDVVLVFVTVSGIQRARLVQETYTKKVYHGKVGDTELSAIQLTTAAGLCAMLDLHREGALPKAGFVKQEDVPLSTFVANRFGRYYA
ncbi:MAG TPA: saccharopine dehydrogenase NADP-binding domain-containing protein [Polyangiales bacterium]